MPAGRLEGNAFIQLQSQDGLLHQTIKASYDKGAPATLRDIKNLLVEPQQVDAEEADQWYSSQGSMTSGETRSTQTRLLPSALSSERTRDTVLAKLKDTAYPTVARLLQQHPAILKWQEQLAKQNAQWYPGMPMDTKLILTDFTHTEVLSFFRKLMVYRQKGGPTSIAQMIIQSELSSELTIRLTEYGVQEYLQLGTVARAVKDLTDNEVIALLLWFSGALQPARWMANISDLAQRHLVANKTERNKIFYLYKFFSEVMAACDDIHPSRDTTSKVRMQIKTLVSSFDGILWYQLGLHDLWDNAQLKDQPLSIQISEFMMLLRCLKTSDTIVQPYRTAESTDMRDMYHDIRKFELAVSDQKQHIVPEKRQPRDQRRSSNGYSSDRSKSSKTSKDNRGKYGGSRSKGTSSTSNYSNDQNRYGHGSSNNKRRDKRRDKKDKTSSYNTFNDNNNFFGTGSKGKPNDHRRNREGSGKHSGKDKSSSNSVASANSKRSFSGKRFDNQKITNDSSSITSVSTLHTEGTEVTDEGYTGDAEVARSEVARDEPGEHTVAGVPVVTVE